MYANGRTVTQWGTNLHRYNSTEKKEDDMENKRTPRNSEIIQWHVDTVRRAATQPFRPHAHPAEGPSAMWRLAAWPQFTSVAAKIYDSPGGLAQP
jgi:hypothetical protein